MGKAVSSSWINCWRFALRCVCAGRTVGQLNESDDRQGDLSFSCSAGDGGEHLPRVLALPFGSDQHTGIEISPMRAVRAVRDGSR